MGALFTGHDSECVADGGRTERCWIADWPRDRHVRHQTCLKSYWPRDSHSEGKSLRDQAKQENCSVFDILNKQLATAAQQKSTSLQMLTSRLHVLPYWHGNRSPRQELLNHRLNVVFYINAILQSGSNVARNDQWSDTRRYSRDHLFRHTSVYRTRYSSYH